MNILNMIDINMPTVSDKVEFYNIDPDTLSFVKFGADIFGTNNYGKIMALYVITTEDISELNLTIQTSSNIVAKVADGISDISDFVSVSPGNSITLANVLQNTPTRITVFFSVIERSWDDGEIEILWSYS
jgi:hypothetical protein